MPPTARSAPRGERRRLPILSAGPASCLPALRVGRQRERDATCAPPAGVTCTWASRRKHVFAPPRHRSGLLASRATARRERTEADAQPHLAPATRAVARSRAVVERYLKSDRVGEQPRVIPRGRPNQNRVIPQRPPLRCGIWRLCPPGRRAPGAPPPAPGGPRPCPRTRSLVCDPGHRPPPVASSTQTRCPESSSHPQRRATRATMRKPRPPASMTPVSRRCGVSPDNPGSCTEMDTSPRTRTERMWIVSAGEPPECTTALVTSSLATRTASSPAAPSSLI